MIFLKSLWRKWLKIVRIIGNFQSQVILSVFYLVVLASVALIFRLLADPLKIRGKVSTSFLKWEHEKEDLRLGQPNVVVVPTGNLSSASLRKPVECILKSLLIAQSGLWERSWQARLILNQLSTQTPRLVTMVLLTLVVTNISGLTTRRTSSQTNEVHTLISLSHSGHSPNVDWPSLMVLRKTSSFT